MKKFGILSYNMYCNFTNYGSALQTYALHRTLNEIAPGQIESVVIDYCPDVLKDKDVLNPLKNMWDVDEESKRMCELSMPVIRINNDKFNAFYSSQYKITKEKYTSMNFNEIVKNEQLDGFICGSDTIWCTLEFKGFDDGYFANYPVMKMTHNISYAPSFGDAVFDEKDKEILKNRLQNFKAISVRERTYIDFIRENTNVLVEQVLDPTLLLVGTEYECITEKRLINEPYILMYTRRYNPLMEKYADRIAEKMGCKVVEISLRATNASKHIMYYQAGVEEFLSLVKYAQYVVTNSFHGVIFSIQMHKDFSAFSREQADVKIDELLQMLNLENRKMVSGEEIIGNSINYVNVEDILLRKRKASLEYLLKAVETTGV